MRRLESCERYMKRLESCRQRSSAISYERLRGILKTHRGRPVRTGKIEAPTLARSARQMSTAEEILQDLTWASNR